MTDILTQRPAEQAPALNTESDIPDFSKTETKPDAAPASDSAATAVAKTDDSQKPADADVQTDATATEGKTPPKDAAPSEDQTEEAKVSKKPWFLKRIDQANEKARAAEAKLQTEIDARARLEAEITARTPPPAPKPEDDPAPDKADFPDPDAYTDARAQWAARQELRQQQDANTRATQERRNAETQARANAAIAALHDSHNKRVEQAKTELPDWDKVALREDVQVPIAAFAEIEHSDMGPHIMYAIGKNPALAKDLTDAYGKPQTLAEHQFGLNRVVRKLVEIEGVIKAERTRTVTKATEPIEPLGGRGTAGPKDIEDESMSEYAARREKELAKSNTRRGMAVRRST